MSYVRARWRAFALILGLAGMLAVIGRSALASDPTEPRESDRDLAARELTPPGGDPELRVQRPDGEWLGGLGVVEPAAPESRLVPGVAGRISRIDVREGEQVEAGQLLVELESGAERAALTAAEAEVAVAEAELLRTRRGLRPEEREALDRDAAAARARAAQSAEVLERLREAAGGGGISEDRLARAARQAEADAASAEGQVARLRASRRGRVEDVRLARARLEVAEARRDEARAQLERRLVRAPIAGEVLEIYRRVGEYVSPGGAEPVVTLGDTRQLRARLDIDERDVARVARGAEAQLVVDALPERRFAGRVVEVARRMGRKNVRTDEPTERIDTRILEVVVELDEPGGLIVGQRVMGYVAPREPGATGRGAEAAL